VTAPWRYLGRRQRTARAAARASQPKRTSWGRDEPPPPTAPHQPDEWEIAEQAREDEIRMLTEMYLSPSARKERL
jgi:hypothetical protein